MNEIDKSIYLTWKEGDYFRSALEWYNYKYIAPVTQRIALLIILIFAVIIFSIVFSIAANVGDQIQRPIFISYISNEYKQISKLEELDNSTSSDLAVADYFIRMFVEKYESYNYDTLQSQTEFLHKYASRSVLNNFYKSYQVANLNSPINLYQTHTIVNIQNVKIDFLLDEFSQAEQAIVNFDVVVYNKTTGQANKSSKKILIGFYLTDIEQVLNKQKPLIFQVREYKLYNKQ